MLVVGLLTVLAAGARDRRRRPRTAGSAAVDEPQYLLSALSLWEDHDLDISDELADRRFLAFHDADLPVQTAVRPDGSQLSPHDPLLPVLLAVPMGLGGWVAAKLTLAALAGDPGRAAALGRRTPVRGAAAAGRARGRAGHLHRPAGRVRAAGLPRAARRPGRAGRRGRADRAPARPPRTLAVLGARDRRAALAVGEVRPGRRRALPRRRGRPVAGAPAPGRGRPHRRARRRRRSSTWPRTRRSTAASPRTPAATTSRAPASSAWSASTRTTRAAASGCSACWSTATSASRPGSRPGSWSSRRWSRCSAPRPRHWPALAVPLLAGWATATWVALTMQGYWWPGRQLVVVLPLAVLVILVWLARARRAAWSRRPRSPPPASPTTPRCSSPATWPTRPGCWPRTTWPLHWPAALLLPDDRDLTAADLVRYAAWVWSPWSQRCSRCVPPAVPVERQRHPERHAEQVRGQHVGRAARPRRPGRRAAAARG